MEYRRLQKAVEAILDKGESQNGNFGWVAEGGQLSKTVTAQVLISLSKYSEMEEDATRKKAILDKIDLGFSFLKGTLLSDGNSLPSFAYSLIAHLDHHSRYPATHLLDSNLIIACVSRMNFFLLGTGTAFVYDNDSSRKFFPSFLALQSYCKLLEAFEKYPALAIQGLTKDNVVHNIEVCFNYILDKLHRVCTNSDNVDFERMAEYLSLGIEAISLFDSFFLANHWRGRNYDLEFCLNSSITFFQRNLNKVFEKWVIAIEETPFKLVYVANLVSGLFAKRSSLSNDGLSLYYQLSLFLTSDPRIQEIDSEGVILNTKTGRNIWGTAHSINTIMDLSPTMNELTWVNGISTTSSDLPKTTPSSEAHGTTNFDFREFLKSVAIRVFLPILTGTITAIVGFNIFQDGSPQLSPAKTIFAYLTLIGIGLSVYFLPYIIISLGSKIARLRLSTKVQERIKFFSYILAIVAYVLMISYYLFKLK